MPSPNAAYTQILPPTSPSHAVACHLTPPSASSTSYPTSRGRLESHLVTARHDTIQIWEVRENGRLFLLKTKTFFGIITGLQATRTIESETDGCSRILISFRDAKLALLEWNNVDVDFETISIHTYERASQLATGLPPNFRPLLSLDPAHRCATLLLPKDALAVLPFTSSSDLDLIDDMDDLEELYQSTSSRTSGQANGPDRKSMPYTPSFVLPLSEVDENIRNVKDVVFLPNFQKPTIAVLCEPERGSWTGSLSQYRDTIHLYIFTLDLSSTSHPVLSHFSGLPYNTLYLQPAQSLGGVFVISASAIFHIDQSGRMTGLKVNKWLERITTNAAVLEMPYWDRAENRDSAIDLCNSQLIWTEDMTMPVLSQDKQGDMVKAPVGSGMLLLKDGRVMALRCRLDGRTVSGLEIDEVDWSGAGTQAPPSLVVAIPDADAKLFVGSMLGDSMLLSIAARRLKDEASADAAPKASMDIDLDDDADLYGDGDGQGAAVNGAASSTTASRLSYVLALNDTLPGLGPIGDLSLAVVRKGQNDITKLAATHGVEPQGGIVLLEDRIQPRNRKPIFDSVQDAVIGACKRVIKVGPHRFLATDPISDVSAIYEVADDGSARQVLSFSAQEQVRSAGWIGDDSYVVITSSSIGIRRSDVEEASHSVLFDSQVEHVSIADNLDSEHVGVVVVSLEEGLAKAFAIVVSGSGDTAARKLQEVCSLDEKTYKFVSLFEDSAGVFTSKAASTAPSAAARRSLRTEEEEVDYGDDDDEMAANDNAQSGVPATQIEEQQLLAAVTKSGSVEIWSLASRQCLWRSNSILDLPMRLEPLAEGGKVVVCSDLTHVQIEDFWVGSLVDQLCLVTIERSGLLTAWTCVKDGEDVTRFTKTLSKEMGEAQADESMLVPPNGETPQSAPRRIVAVDGVLGGGLSLFVTGSSRSGWVHQTAKGGLQFFESAHQAVNGLGELSEHTYVVSDQDGLSVAQTDSSLNFDLPIARTHYCTGRQYTRLRPFPTTRTIVAASTSVTPFVQFDTEDMTVVRDLELDPSFALSKRGAIELFKCDDEPVDGFEFEQNETVSALELVTLTSASSPTGLKDFIAVGTTVFNGEDRPTRGAMYIFDVVETVPNQDDPDSNGGLKLLVKDDAKGPVTAMSDISGYLVVSTGQRMFVRAFEKHEALVNVAFLDVGFLTTSMRRLGSTLLLSDLQRSVIFVGFQEAPFRLSIFGRHVAADTYTTTGDYLLSDETMGFVTTDWRGTLRLLEYNAALPGAQQLLVRTEFATGMEFTASLSRARLEAGADDAMGVATSNELLLSSAVGSLSVVRAASQSQAALGTALHNQMIRNVQHAAALNPRGYRIVKNDALSRPLNRGVLDGALLGEQGFSRLSRPKRQELVALTGAKEDAREDAEDLTEAECSRRIVALFS